jgi:hypothetical protein
MSAYLNAYPALNTYPARAPGQSRAESACHDSVPVIQYFLAALPQLLILRSLHPMR